jgi:hypothetical protein
MGRIFGSAKGAAIVHKLLPAGSPQWRCTAIGCDAPAAVVMCEEGSLIREPVCLAHWADRMRAANAAATAAAAAAAAKRGGERHEAMSDLRLS